ncbi:MAG: hypothetical protein HQK50_00425 [Oligoflexia bacterium]|nr:hypothetical protein [Oligoflexia bacterium]
MAAKNLNFYAQIMVLVIFSLMLLMKQGVAKESEEDQSFLEKLEQLENQEVITSKTINNRCQALVKDRDYRLQLKQKANALKKRVQRLQKNVPPKKIYLVKKLDYIMTEINQELHLINLQIVSMEENIVRKGCPGVKI